MFIKETIVYTAFVDLEKSHDRIDWEPVMDVLKVYGVGRKLLSGVKAFYKYHTAWRS